MKPGRELDALVAEKVMGWRVGERFDGDWYLMEPASGGMGGNPVPMRLEHYSTDIAAAWQLVEKVGTGWLYLTLTQDSDRTSDYWRAAFHRRTDAPDAVNGDTAPHAICLAALKVSR